jgi:hypothetical protein
MSDKNTIVTSYAESCEILDYMDDFCGCCFSNFFNEWYDKNEAYFVRKGIFVIDNLMFLDCLDNKGNDEHKSVRYCFQFDFTDNNKSNFTILNYYNREKVAEFNFKRSDFSNLKDVTCSFDFIDIKAYKRLGFFANSIIRSKVEKKWELFFSRNASLPKAKFNDAYSKQNLEEDKMILQFMCDHSIEIILSTMCYYTKEKPEQISYESFIIKEDLEYTTKTVKYTYNYTGYINLNDTKVYRTTINKNLKDEKNRDYQRHIQSWSVKGHYRTIKGKKVWIKEHTRGEGELENRIYGTKPESEVLLIPKVIECEREVRVYNGKNTNIIKDLIVFENEHKLIEIIQKPKENIINEKPITIIKITLWIKLKNLFSLFFKSKKQ